MKKGLEANLKLDDIDRDKPVVYTIRGKERKIGLITNYTHGRFSRLVTKAELSYTDDNGKLLVNMENNRKLVFKCVALMMLGGPIRIWLFYGILWRWLYLFGTQEEMAAALNVLMAKTDWNSLFFCLNCLQLNNSMNKMMARENTSTIAQKLNSAKDTTPSQPSTVA